MYQGSEDNMAANSSILTRLPAEIITRIMMEFNPVTLLVVLETCPALRDLVVILTDNPGHASQVVPRSLGLRTLPLANHQKFFPGNALIKFVEITQDRTVADFQVPKEQKFLGRWFDRNTLVVTVMSCQRDTHSFDGLGSWCQQRGARFYMINDNMAELYPREMQVRQSLEANAGMCSVIYDITEHNNGGAGARTRFFGPQMYPIPSFVPHGTLSSLQCIKIHVSSRSNGEPAEVCGIDAPYLRVFELVYEGAFPILTNLALGYALEDFLKFRDSRALTNDTYPGLPAGNVNITRLDHSSEVAQKFVLCDTQDNGSLDRSDLSFTKYFTSFKFEGVPDLIIFENANLVNASSLTWIKTSVSTAVPSFCVHSTVQLPCLRELDITTYCPESPIPHMCTSSWFRSFNLKAYAPIDHSSLNRFLSGADMCNLTTIQICYTPEEIGWPTPPDSLYALPLDVYRKLQQIPVLSYLSLIGHATIDPKIFNLEHNVEQCQSLKTLILGVDGIVQPKWNPKRGAWVSSVDHIARVFPELTWLGMRRSKQCTTPDTLVLDTTVAFPDVVRLEVDGFSTIETSDGLTLPLSSDVAKNQWCSVAGPDGVPEFVLHNWSLKNGLPHIGAEWLDFVFIPNALYLRMRGPALDLRDHAPVDMADDDTNPEEVDVHNVVH